MFRLPLHRTALVAACALLACGLVVLIGAPRASAVPTSQPWQSDACWSSACTWSSTQGTYVAGGDGTSISSYMSGSWGSNINSIIQETAATAEAEAADELPLLQTLPGLQTIVLGSAAFSFGWAIGSTINTKWLHLGGVGLGTTAATDGLWVTGFRWVHIPADTTHGFPSGWLWEYFDTWGNTWQRFWYPEMTSSCSRIWYAQTQAAQNFDGHGTIYSWGTQSLCGMTMTTVERLIPDAAMPANLIVDLFQAYSGQPFTGLSGWKVPGGCGDTSTACPYPGSQTNPAPSATKLRCELSGDSAYCGSGCPAIAVVPDGTGFFGGAGSCGTGLGSGAEGDMNCIADPLDFICPSTTSDGKKYSTSGSAAGAMPNCYGLSADACEGAIRVIRPDATFSVTTASSLDPKVADGLVIATTPTANTDPAPAHIDISINPDNSQPQQCTWSVQNPHESSGTPGAVDVKAEALCNYQTTITATLTLWKCDEQPSADLNLLNSGSWGCFVAAVSPTGDNTRLALPGDPVTFQAPEPGGNVVSPDGKWFIAYGTLDKGDPPQAFSNVVQLF
jgi:hypothetical protein